MKNVSGPRPPAPARPAPAPRGAVCWRRSAAVPRAPACEQRGCRTLALRLYFAAVRTESRWLEQKPRGHAAGAARSPVARLRAICLALPETSEKIAWGEPTFRVRDKIFAQLDDHHHGADRLAVWLPMPIGAQEGLVYADPTRFFVPPYVGRRGWVGVRLDRRPNWSRVATLLREAYGFVAPARLAAALASGAADRAPGKPARPLSGRTRRRSPTRPSRGGTREGKRAPARPRT